VDELVFILLSQMTTYHSFNRVFDRLKLSVPDWESVLFMPEADLESFIHDAGLSNQKAPRIRAIFEKLRADFGAVSLDALRSMNTMAAERYLTCLPGIGVKSARCIMMYSLGLPVLPVDTHVWRVARRLGLVGEAVPYNRVHDELHHVVRPADRYSFHVNALSLGRQACIAKRPRCSACPLQHLCPTGQRN
jgi:endonuclease III